MHPRISIVCPVRNVEKYIEQTIQSVIDQSYKNWELLIMDGASTDGTIEVVQKYTARDPRIKLYSEKDESPWDATDRGIDRAAGEFLCVIAGQDGFLDQEWLSKCTATFTRDHEISLVWASSRGMHEDGTLFHPYHVTYSHLMRRESWLNSVKNLFLKTGLTFWDLLSGDATRKKIILKKIFSRTIGMKLSFLASRSFPEGKVPQKEGWFSYWLKTGFIFSDQAMCVDKKVYLACAPRYPRGTRMVNHMTDFNFNFNSRGYLAYHIPTLATFGRTHPGNSADRVADELHNESEKYLKKIMDLRKKIMGTHQWMTFVDREGTPVSKKQF